MKIDGSDSPEKKFEIMNTFRTAPERVLTMNTTAVREGMDFLYIENVIIVEAQLVPSAMEEQFECRFFNPDPQIMEDRGLKNKVTNYEYLVPKGTIDDYYRYDMDEQKRQIFGETVTNSWSIDDPDTFAALLEENNIE